VGERMFIYRTSTAAHSNFLFLYLLPMDIFFSQGSFFDNGCLMDFFIICFYHFVSLSQTSFFSYPSF
jgi:hypothetical protein